MAEDHEVEAVAAILGWFRQLSEPTAEAMSEAVWRYVEAPRSFNWELEFRQATAFRAKSRH